MSGQELYDKEMARLRAENERLKTGIEYMRKILGEAIRLLETVEAGDRNV